ncbi:OB-fold protein [Flavobacterium daejeonense]|uniref:OB-fold protein n=1 Tax=Flavobacterium daejeonense TaxID=350893 RepID=UPI00047AD4CD|nr:hypothetical protein [Flavobacterium daejeonense]
MKKKVSIGILILLLFLVAAYFYVYQGHRDIATEKESYAVDVKTLFGAYQNNETDADTKYLNKTIVVSGEVSLLNPETHSVVLNQKLFAVFTDTLPSEVTIKSNVKIKGRLIGYDSLLEQLKMDQCIILN